MRRIEDGDTHEKEEILRFTLDDKIKNGNGHIQQEQNAVKVAVKQ